MNITLDQLKTLDAVVSEGSFSAASRILNKAQSAVSYDVRQLESALEIDLFDRSGHRARLTEEGEIILQEARTVLNRARALEGIAARYRDNWEPRLQVVIDGILPMGPIMKALKTMVEEDVPTQITTRVEFLGGVQSRFEHDAADLMLVKDYNKHSGLRAYELPTQECVLLVAPDHSLAELGRRGVLHPVDLQPYIQLLVQDSSNQERNLDRYLMGESKVYYLSDFYTKHQGLSMGLGYGWMPRHLVDEDLRKGVLQELNMQGDSRYTFTPYAVYPNTKPLGKAGRRLLQLIKEYFPSYSEGAK